MIPELLDGAYLPPGGHDCTWEELVERFSMGGERQRLCRELRLLLERAKRCGFLRVAIGGSFPTSKPDPSDLDLLFLTPTGMSKASVSPECAKLMNGTSSKLLYGHDLGYCEDEPETVQRLIHGYGFDWRTGKDRGMLILDLSCI